MNLKVTLAAVLLLAVLVANGNARIVTSEKVSR